MVKQKGLWAEFRKWLSLELMNLAALAAPANSDERLIAAAGIQALARRGGARGA